MSDSCISDNLTEKLSRIFSADSDTIHFLWEVNDRRVINMGGAVEFPEDTENPFMHMLEKGLVHPESKSFYEIFIAQIMDCLWSREKSLSRSFNIDIQMRFSEDTEDYRFCHVYAILLCDESGMNVHVNIRPFSDKELFDREILDSFTSDKNPELFTRRCMDNIERFGDGRTAFIQFDIEGFKLINEQYGVKTGDEILKFITDSIKMICDDNQPCTRLTADVFMICTPFEDRKELIRFVRMLDSRLGYFKNIEYRLAFGISIVTDSTKHSRHWGDCATLARKSVKGGALENIGFYQEEMIGSLQKQKEIEEDMHNALLNHEFKMYLQPKYSISTGRIIGAEALARWIHPRRGMISPAEFIPVFEHNGFIIKLDRYIWEEACRKLRHWIDLGLEPVPISVNVSREYLQSADVIDIITTLVEKYNIPARLLELEITETVESNNVRDVVSRFKKCGFTMLMDDFGSGYSSLNMLKSTPFDVLKIDRGFFSEFMESDRGRKIITHTISMSQDIGLDIIAEGVETNEQAQFLSECGCDAAQGYLYSRPIPHEEMDKVMINL